MVSGQLYPEENCPQLGLGFRSKSGLVSGWGTTRQLPQRKIAPWLGLGSGLGLVLGLGGNFSRTQNIYNPIAVILWQFVDHIRHRLPKLVVWQSYHQWPKRLWDSFFHLFYFVNCTTVISSLFAGEIFHSLFTQRSRFWCYSNLFMIFVYMITFSSDLWFLIYVH